MNRAMLRALLLAALVPGTAPAVTVSPTGVNVRSSGTTTVFLTFNGLEQQTPVEAVWCGEIAADNSCVPGTVFGRLPQRSNLARPSGGRNLTDIMTIPATVSRRAYEDAKRSGDGAEFFYVRRFRSDTGGPDEFVAVTCRMTGGGARSPLAVTDVRLAFEGEDAVVPSFPRGTAPPRFAATIAYNGSGRLKGRWEVVLPGDTPPSNRDLLSEATLPIDERGSQRRYTQIDRFDAFLAPTGKTTIPGPDPSKLPTAADGLHLILFRVEASADPATASTIAGGIVPSGGVAGFTFPVLRYYVGGGPPKEEAAAPVTAPKLLEPAAEARLASGELPSFRWTPVAKGAMQELQVRDGEETVLSAVLGGDASRYSSPPWIRERAGKPLEWRVQALDAAGKPVAESEWRKLELAPVTAE